MKAQEKIDKILELVTKKIQEEVTSLIGAELTLSESDNTLISKEDFFDQPSGKLVALKLDITGEIEGTGCMLVRVKDAIRLGGTLIMLPLNELEQAIAADDYNEETKDSFGEIANIISGSYTKVFEEIYPKSCRFIRKEQEVIIPAKVEIDSAEPVPDQLLYQVKSSMKLDDTEMGELTILLPASTFGLEEEQEHTEKAGDVTQEPQETQEADNGKTPEEITPDSDEGAKQEPVEERAAPKVTVDVSKHRKRVDALLDQCRVKIEEEVGALLGVEIKIGQFDNRPVSKEHFFLEEVSEKQVLANMKVTGAKEDKSYLFVDLKDAIRIGGILIMLPPAELDASVAEEDFSVDAQDAYGEIANIIAGVYTSFFESGYSESLRFIRTELDQVTPLALDMSSEEPISEQVYYMSSGGMTIEDKAYGKIHMLFPLPLLQLEGLEEEDKVEETKSSSARITATKQKAGGISEAGEETHAKKTGSYDVILMSDDAPEAEKILTVLQSSGYSVKILSFKNSITDYISDSLKAVFLVMHEVNEQTFGVMIKVSSACSVPLVAAGPAWTRTKVIKAVKYGVTDILLTPAAEQDIQEKIDNNLVQLAA